MFVPNSHQQLSLYDSFKDLPKYLQEYLLNSWAHTFQEVIFPAIEEERFAVLYSDKGSRPNTPVNIIISSLVIKELFNLTDERLIANVHLSMEYQYALRLTSEKRPPISKNTFSNFRERVTDYYKETGIDLIQQEVESLADLIREHLEIEGNRARIDSFMVSSSARELSRIELVYVVNAKFIKTISKLSKELISEGLEVYLKESHRNNVIYHTKNDETKNKLQKLLEDAKTLYDTAVNAGEQITDTEEFELLKRMLGEQTDHNDDDFDDIDPDNIEAKDGTDLGSDILQNPSDPDATFRQKYKANIGYTANVVEFFDGNNSVIKSYDFKPNIYSDQSFSADTLDKLTNDPAIKDKPENPFKLFMDGAYYSYDLAKKAIKAGIKYMPGELTGKKTAADKLNVDDMPVRGEVCQKIWFGFKVAAANFKKLLKGLELATS